MEQNGSEAITRTRLHKQVARTLSLQILNGDILPDSLLPNEDALSRQFGVSKPVVREAISFMDAKGLVRARPRVGTRICTPDNWVLTDPVLLKWRIEAGPQQALINDLLELRAIIEPIAAGLAAKRATPEGLAKIARAMQAMSAGNSLEDHIAADIEFHRSIIEASGNELLISTLRPVLEHTMGSSFQHFITSVEAAKASVPFHQEVVTAILHKDEPSAIAAMQKVIERSANDIKKSMVSTPVKLGEPH